MKPAYPINITRSDVSPEKLPKDIFAGLVIALVSIPISMGYAQVAGLPARFGLYGSVFPILIFGLFSSSKQFIFGVDAAPAALVGAFLAEQGIESGSARAVSIVPMMTLATALWLFIMYFLKAGRLVKYISTPVMGGFISGISTTIILMQVPKLLGGTSGMGELPELAVHIYKTCENSFVPASLIMGGTALGVLLLGKRFAPKVPMSVIVMAAGAVVGYSGLADKYGVAKLSAIERGLPAWSFPHIEVGMISDVLRASLPVALVIMSETLLASSSTAGKHGQKLDSGREVLVYALGNLSACFVGCCPVNGSVSRTAMGGQLGGRSQVMSLTASAVMAGILLFGTGFIGYLPVPILTSIVIAALIGAIEFDLIKELHRHDRRELVIFFGAFFGVLLFGTVYGVAIGCVLSFAEVIKGTARPKRSFLGVIEGHEGFHSLERNSCSVPIKGAVLYRFSGNLYFANVGLFTDEIEAALKPDTRCVIVDSGAVCGIDITAAESIRRLDDTLKAKGVRLYFASHIGSLNDRFRQLGLGYMVEEGHCRRTIPAALTDAGFKPPYTPEHEVKTGVLGDLRRLEFEWAFGEQAEQKLEEYALRLADSAEEGEDIGELMENGTVPHGLGLPDREELLTRLQAHVGELSDNLNADEQELSDEIELRRIRLAVRLKKRDRAAFRLMAKRNMQFSRALRAAHPELYEKLKERRRLAAEHIAGKYPEYASDIAELYETTEDTSENE